MTIFDGSFWIVAGIIFVLGWLFVNWLASSSVRRQAPQGRTTEEKFEYICRRVNYDASGEFLLFCSNVVCVALTHESILCQFTVTRGDNTNLVTRVIPVRSVSRIETEVNNEKKYGGYTWGWVILHETNGNTFSIKLPTKEIDSFIKAWGQTPA
ncbi:hypothetical protein [Clostridium minihomine]|uniref:hypothetical protein n=1 Tax=Clostridium minihomine TaxID=2045012 RepID=UPI000C78A0F7|nr:hypothetical protein [Clostridium minihomine]